MPQKKIQRPNAGAGKHPPDLRQAAQTHAEAALAALAAVFNDPKASPSARVSAAVAILNWGYGRPTPTSISENPTTTRQPALVKLIWAEPEATHPTTTTA